MSGASLLGRPAGTLGGRPAPNGRLKFLSAQSAPSCMLRTGQHDSWLDVGGILSYPGADPCIARSVQTCVGTYHGLENGSWMTIGVRRKLGPQSRCEEDSMALQLNHVHLKTHDPEKTAQFYVETLGAKIVGKAGTNGYRLDLHGLSLNVTTFLESQTREQTYGVEHLAIDSDEFDTIV